MGEKSKKLVLMIPQLRHGGAERVVSRLSFLMRDTYNICIVVFDNTNITYDVGCRIVSLNAKPTVKNNIILKVLNVIKRVYLYNRFKKNNNIDITYSFGDTANIVNILSFGRDKKITSIRGFKRIRSGNGIKDKYILKPISKYICSQSDKIVSVSELISKTLAKEYNINHSKIKTIYNGYDINSIQKKSLEDIPDSLLKKIDGNRVIITAGTFRAEKGYWHLLKAFSIVLKDIKDIKLVILGQDYKNYKEKVEKLAEELNISDDIIFGGYQSNPFKFFSRSTIYVLSSTSEGFPNALVEAMACGLPVIASDCKSGPREIIAPNTNLFKTTESIELGEYGVLVKAMNGVENYQSDIIEDCDKYLANAIKLLLNDDELRMKYKFKAKQRVTDFSYEEWLKKQNETLLS